MKQIQEPARTIPVMAETDVLVVGGGPGGLAAALTGFGVSSAHLLPRAMTPDVLEVDELMSGKRQEGIYSGFSVFVRKLSIGLVLAMVGPALAWSGYVEAADAQSPSALTAIRLLMSVLPALLFSAASVVAWFYPLTRQRHAEILNELARRRGVEYFEGR